MEVNYFAILLCGVLSMVIGFVWYGPLFGKLWLKVIGATEADLERRKEMQKKAMPLYAVQFALALFQAFTLAYFIRAWSDLSALAPALFIFAGFIVPVIAGACMWNNDSAKIAWTRFLLQGGYQLVLMVVFAVILGSWQ